MNHMFVDGAALCGFLGTFNWTVRVAAVTCPACLATLRYLGAPAKPVRAARTGRRGVLIGSPKRCLET
jgi:hypothetical protein